MESEGLPRSISIKTPSSRTFFSHPCKGRRVPILSFILRPTYLSLLLFFLLPLLIRIWSLPRLPTENASIVMQHAHTGCTSPSHHRTYRALAAIINCIDLAHSTEERRRRRCAWREGWAGARCRQWRRIGRWSVVWRQVN